jgi:hypothetical protein
MTSKRSYPRISARSARADIREFWADMGDISRPAPYVIGAVGGYLPALDANGPPDGKPGGYRKPERFLVTFQGTSTPEHGPAARRLARLLKLALQLAAERRMGELLRETERRKASDSKGGGSKGSHRIPLPDAPPTLAELGVSKKESAQAQKLAALPGKGDGGQGEKPAGPGERHRRAQSIIFPSADAFWKNPLIDS